MTKATAAVTSSRTPSLPPSGRSRALKIAGVAALAAAIVGVIVIGSRSASEPRVETAEPADSKPPAPQEAAASPATSSADGAESDAAAGVVEEEAVEQLDSAEAQAASSAVTAPRPAPRARPAPRPAPKPTATAPAPKPAPVPAPKPTSNPFDRRF